MRALRPAEGGLLWRTAKADVAHELGLPPQSGRTALLQLSAIERHFYMRQHQARCCRRRCCCCFQLCPGCTAACALSDSPVHAVVHPPASLLYTPVSCTLLPSSAALCRGWLRALPDMRSRDSEAMDGGEGGAKFGAGCARNCRAARRTRARCCRPRCWRRWRRARPARKPGGSWTSARRRGCCRRCCACARPAATRRWGACCQAHHFWLACAQ